MFNILIALLVVGAVGLVAGVLLVLASYFFRIEEEEKTKLIRECLPGSNCGACGYTGCDGYAKALALGEAEPHLCVPGAIAVAEKLSEVLGVEVKANEPIVAFVGCNGTCDATSKKADYEGVDSCLAASMLYGGPNVCRFGCIGCGDCASVCPVDAICFEDGIARVDSRICIGCGMCAKECPKDIISIIHRDARVAVMCNSNDKGAVARKNCKNACIGCKKCEVNCPTNAITVIDNLSVIDYDKCIACGKCAEVCPTHCIKLTDFAAHSIIDYGK